MEKRSTCRNLALSDLSRSKIATGDWFCEFTVKFRQTPLTVRGVEIRVCSMDKANLDQLRLDYKRAVDAWVDTIRSEEALATPDHSMTAMEKWDEAHFAEQDAQRKAAEAREAYKDGLRSVNYSI